MKYHTYSHALWTLTSFSVYSVGQTRANKWRVILNPQPHTRRGAQGAQTAIGWSSVCRSLLTGGCRRCGESAVLLPAGLSAVTLSSLSLYLSHTCTTHTHRNTHIPQGWMSKHISRLLQTCGLTSVCCSAVERLNTPGALQTSAWFLWSYIYLHMDENNFHLHTRKTILISNL